MITTLLLDLDNTLIDRDGAMRGWLESVAPTEAVAELTALDRGGYGDRVALFVAIARKIEVDPATVRRWFFRDLPTFVRPDPAVHALLDAFPGPKLVLTRGRPDVQHAKLAAAELTERVSRVWVGASDRPKPFAEALAHAGRDAGGACMVGDHPVFDIADAHRAGLAAVFVRTRWFGAPVDVPAIDRVTELPW